MPPYFRFPETEGIQQRFWGCRPCNPLCGLISLERGTKIFAWGNIIYGAATTILCAIFFILPLFIGHGETGELHHELLRQAMKEHKNLSLGNEAKMKGDDWIAKIYLKQTFALLQAILFISFLVFGFLWFVSWKLKKSVVERDLPELKKNFFIMLCLFIVLCIPYLIESEVLWSRAILLDVPIFAFQIIGLIFTHAFIVSLISPESSSQQDDLNRIQFSP